MLKVRDLSARNHQDQLVDINLTIGNSEILAVVGPETSGKNLLGQTLAGQISLDSGQVIINHYRLDLQPEKARRQLGYVSTDPDFSALLTAFEYLDLAGSIYHLSPTDRTDRIVKLASNLNFTDQLYSLIDTQSLAIKQKINLAAALIHQPSLLIIDEPLVHLDFTDQLKVASLIDQAKKDGATIILITNDLTLAEELADQFLVLDSGSVIATGSLKELVNQTQPKNRDLTGVYLTLFSQ